MDVDTAFLNSKLDSPVYVRQPPDFKSQQHTNLVWKLNGGMYGLKQSPLLWDNHIHSALASFGFTRHDGDYGLYFLHSSAGPVLVALYVDDLLISTPNANIMTKVKRALMSKYSMKDLGRVNKFLGMTIRQLPDRITLDLSDYISNSAIQSSIPLHRTVNTPLTDIKPLFNLSSTPISNITTYQSIIGQLLFVANSGRPDIAYSVSMLSRFLKDPREVHLAAAKKLFQYLYTTRHYGLQYHKRFPLDVVIFSDVSSPPAVDLPYSTGGYVTSMAGGTITWSSTKITEMQQ